MKNFVISMFGLITSLIVVAALVFVELEWEFAFYSMMHFFVIPTGAIISGIAAAGGYYFGALFLNSKPTPTILISMVGISVGAYFAINYATYMLLEADGVPVSELVDFRSYMEIMLTSMSMTVGRARTETGELGSLGYVVALLQIVGFAGGGVATYLFLKSKAYCDLCDKYYKKIWEDTRFSGEHDSNEMLEGIKEVAAAFSEEDVAGARERHNKIGIKKSSNKTHLRTQLTLKKCPECERQLFALEASRQKGNDWEVIGDLSFSNVFPGRRDIR